MAESLFKKLDKLDVAITAAIAANGSLKSLLSKYEHTIDKLPEEDGVAARAEQYQEKWANYLVAQATFEGDVARAAAAAQPTPPPKDDLPKAEAIKHNGRMEAFDGFWSCFTRRFVNRVGAAKLTDDELHTRLCGLLSETDRDSILSLSYDEAKKRLIKKYRDPDAIRQHINQKFVKVGVCKSKDGRALDTLELALRESIPLVESADPAAPELLVMLFNIAYSRLDEKLQDRFWGSFKKGLGKPDELLTFVEETKSVLCQHQVAVLSIGGAQENKPPRNASNKIGRASCRERV